MKIKLNLFVTILIVITIGIAYTVQNYILVYFDDCSTVWSKLQGLCATRWFPFVSVAILAGLIPFSLFVTGALLILKKYE
jgi:hypothetical protein